MILSIIHDSRFEIKKVSLQAPVEKHSCLTGSELDQFAKVKEGEKKQSVSA